MIQFTMPILICYCIQNIASHQHEISPCHMSFAFILCIIIATLIFFITLHSLLRVLIYYF